MPQKAPLIQKHKLCRNRNGQHTLHHLRAPPLAASGLLRSFHQAVKMDPEGFGSGSDCSRCETSSFCFSASFPPFELFFPSLSHPLSLTHLRALFFLSSPLFLIRFGASCEQHNEVIFALPKCKHLPLIKLNINWTDECIFSLLWMKTTAVQRTIAIGGSSGSPSTLNAAIMDCLPLSHGSSTLDLMKSQLHCRKKLTSLGKMWSPPKEDRTPGSNKYLSFCMNDAAPPLWGNQ